MWLARAWPRVLTNIARDLKDPSDMLNGFRPDEIASRLDAIGLVGKEVLRHLEANSTIARSTKLVIADRVSRLPGLGLDLRAPDWRGKPSAIFAIDLQGEA